MNKNIDFVNGNTKKCLLEMTVPMIIAMFLNMAYNLVDSLWIGNLLGEQAYAALTNSTPIILILTSIGMGATNGLAILLSQVIGAKNEQKKKNIIVTSFFVSIILSVFMTIVLEIFLEPILIVLNTPTEIFDMAKNYLSIYALGYVAVYLYLYFTAILTATSVISRKKELALLEVVGMTKKQISKMLVAEGFLYLGGAFMIAVLLVVVGAKQILINTLGTAFFFRLHLTIL